MKPTQVKRAVESGVEAALRRERRKWLVVSGVSWAVSLVFFLLWRFAR